MTSKLECGVSTPSDIFDSVNGLVQKQRSPKHYSKHSSDLLGNVTAGNTRLMMMMVPVEYTSIRIGYTHQGGDGDVTGASALIGASDDIGDLSYTNTAEGKKFITPNHEGAEQNTVSEFGWRNVTWGGNATFDITDPTVGETATVYSDLIDLPARALADNSFTGYYPLLIRMYAGTGIATVTSSFTSQTLPQYFIDSGDNMIMNATRSGENVTNPATWHQGNTPSFSSSTNLPLTIEAYTAEEHKSVLCVGDSRLGSSPPSESSIGYKTLQWRIERDLNAAGTKSNIVASAKGGYTANEYFKTAIDILASGDVLPTDAVYLIYSINDGIPTDAIIANSKAKALRFIDRCVDLNITPLLMTSFPRGTGYTVDELALLDGVEDFAASTGYKAISPLKIYGDASGVWSNAADHDDNDHMSPSGQDDLSSRTVTILTT